MCRTFPGGAPDKVNMVERGERSAKGEAGVCKTVKAFSVVSRSVLICIMSHVHKGRYLYRECWSFYSEVKVG